VSEKPPVPLAAQISALHKMLEGLRSGVLSAPHSECLIEDLEAALATLQLFERHELAVRLTIRRAARSGS
jgi:hypothetical protein